VRLGQPEPGPEYDLTERQRKVVQVIRDSIERCGFPPSLREIGDAVELKSTSAVSHQLAALESKGVLRRQPGRSRAIELLPPAQTAASTPKDAAVDVLAQEIVLVPLMGRIAAGPPMLAEENIEGKFPVPSWQLPGSGKVFLLKIVGDSMIGAGIKNGDLVLVRNQPDAENGDIVAAMIDDEATVKTLTRSAGHVWLMPHNQAYTPIPGDDAIIIGKVVSVLRKIER
jgi:repressor LexA